MTRNEFLQRRKSGIGGSDIAAIVGLSPWKTPLAVYCDKVNPSTAETETPATHWGTVLEDVVAREFAERMNLAVRKCTMMFRYKGYPFIVANLDRVVVQGNKSPVNYAKGTLVTDTILECKTARMADGWGEPMTDGIPEHYKCQVQWYMGITGAKRCFVAVLIGGSDYRIYLVRFSPEQFAYLLAEGVKFWTEYVEKRVEPPPQSVEDVERVYRGSVGKELYADFRLHSLINDYRAVHENIDALKKTAEGIKADICTTMEDATLVLSTDREKLLTWSAAKDASRVDWEAVAMELHPTPELIEKHTKKTTTARRFCLAKTTKKGIENE